MKAEEKFNKSDCYKKLATSKEDMQFKVTNGTKLETGVKQNTRTRKEIVHDERTHVVLPGKAHAQK